MEDFKEPVVPVIRSGPRSSSHSGTIMTHNPCSRLEFGVGIACVALEDAMSRNMGSMSKPWLGSGTDCARRSSRRDGGSEGTELEIGCLAASPVRPNRTKHQFRKSVRRADCVGFRRKSAIPLVHGLLGQNLVWEHGQAAVQLLRRGSTAFICRGETAAGEVGVAEPMSPASAHGMPNCWVVGMRGLKASWASACSAVRS